MFCSAVIAASIVSVMFVVLFFTSVKITTSACAPEILSFKLAISLSAFAISFFATAIIGPPARHVIRATQSTPPAMTISLLFLIESLYVFICCSRAGIPAFVLANIAVN
ncbi:Uncharacterised protein [Streptococcus pneumoniae]|nr:Uncharacterised protein [Streptococcus pneumoniae]